MVLPNSPQPKHVSTHRLKHTAGAAGCRCTRCCSRADCSPLLHVLRPPRTHSWTCCCCCCCCCRRCSCWLCRCQQLPRCTGGHAAQAGHTVGHAGPWWHRPAHASLGHADICVPFAVGYLMDPPMLTPDLAQPERVLAAFAGALWLCGLRARRFLCGCARADAQSAPLA